MIDTKVTTVIVNATKQGLVMRVGNRNCYAKLTSFKVGSEYRLKLDVNWTYQEFVVQDKSDAANRLFLSSDDCCDCERITIEENPDTGKLTLNTLLRRRHQFRSQEPCSTIILEGQCMHLRERKKRTTSVKGSEVAYLPFRALIVGAPHLHRIYSSSTICLCSSLSGVCFHRPAATKVSSTVETHNMTENHLNCTCAAHNNQVEATDELPSVTVTIGIVCNRDVDLNLLKDIDDLQDFEIERDGNNPNIIVFKGIYPDNNFDEDSILELVQQYDGNARFA